MRTRSNSEPPPVAARSAVEIGRDGPVPAASGLQRLVIEDFPQPEVARALSPNGRAHWAEKKRHREHVELVMWAAVRIPGLKPMTGLVTMRAIFVVPNRRRRDDDNLATGVLKVVRDCLVRGGYLQDDDIDHLRQLSVEVRIEKGRRALILEFTSEPLL